jgi:hypothetical protein
MLKLITVILNFLVLTFQSLASLIKVVFLSSGNKAFRKLKPLSDRTFILGNGPSLKEVLVNQLDLIKSANVICVNYFAVSDEYTIVKPDYYVIIDRIVFSDSFTPESEEKSRLLFEKIARDTSWNMCLFVPREAKKQKKWLLFIKENSNIQIIYLNLTPVEGFKKLKHCLFNRNYGMPRPHNVLIAAIYVALKINYKNIVLFGTEHSWLKDLFVDKDNRVVFYNPHFYDGKSEPIQFCYNDISGRVPVKYHEALYTFMISFKNYHVLQDYAIYKNADVINCTENSFIDAFPKVLPEKLTF